MLPLPERLAAIARILERDNHELDALPDAELTGFLPVLPEFLAQSILEIARLAPPRKDDGTMRSSLDLGCGNGGWMLMAAAAGYPSYGIEINPMLVEHARQNYDEAVQLGLIDPAVPFRLCVGDMIPPRHRARYKEFADKHPEVGKSMPQNPSGKDDFAQLGVDIASADILYTWAWPTQSRFVFNMLEREARADALFVLPCYVRYTQGEHMNYYFKERNELVLEIIANPAKDVYIGRRAA